MVQNYGRAAKTISDMLAAHSAEELQARLTPKPGSEPARIPDPRKHDAATIAARWGLIGGGNESRRLISDETSIARAPLYQRNIENYIGTVRLPVGVAGPLRVNGVAAQGDYFVPLATTEAALVASYARGSWLITSAGGASAAVLNEAVTRTPGFAFASIYEAGAFVSWLAGEIDRIRSVAESTTRHGKLVDLAFHLQGNNVYVVFSYTTGEASGQNMVTIATDAACRHIIEHTPVKPRRQFLDANMSGDKKASVLSFQSVRGRSVTAEVTIPSRLVNATLHTDVRTMVDFWRMSALGGVMSGTIGVQAHFANGLAAVYIATGQDAACVSESAVGVTRMEETDAGDLYAAVSLPNVMVGTVGGGTGLPEQSACLGILGIKGPGSANALAEICAALCLAGEMSIIGAFAAGDFSRAHQSHARGGD